MYIPKLACLQQKESKIYFHSGTFSPRMGGAQIM